MKRAGIGLAVALACAAAAAPAEGATANGCGGTWTGDSRSCTFIYYGGPVYVNLGMRSTSAGVANIRLEAPPAPLAPGLPKSPVARLLAQCSAQGGFSGCFSTAQSDRDLVARGTRLTCTVTARNARGTYRCSSGG